MFVVQLVIRSVNYCSSKQSARRCGALAISSAIHKRSLNCFRGGIHADTTWKHMGASLVPNLFMFVLDVLIK